MKEEKLEEAAKAYAHYHPTDPDKFAILEMDAFKAGAKWQQEQGCSKIENTELTNPISFSQEQDFKVMYTEEEVKTLITKFYGSIRWDEFGNIDICLKETMNIRGMQVPFGTDSPTEWYEQNKKK